MTSPSTRRLPAVLVSGVAAALVLAGCTSTEEGSASPASTSAGSSAASSSAEGSTSTDDLTPGLLPEDAFGAGSVVTPLSEAELEQGASLGDLSGITITPETCAQALQDSQPGVEDLDAFAAQSATSGTSVVVELISTGGGQDDAVSSLAAAVATCPQATISSPEVGTATVTFAVLEVPDLGDGSAALSYTTTVTGPDGSTIAVPALVGLVADGDRLVTLVSTSLGGTVDQAGFGTLLQQAYEFQADALD